MKITFTLKAWEEYVGWQTEDGDIVDKINDLIDHTRRDPFKGLGKPEPLKGSLQGYWSRRITQEHRMVYKVEGIKPNQVLTIVQVRFHYGT